MDLVRNKAGFWRYENFIVFIMFMAYGFVMMDRLSIVYLFHFIAPELKLNNTEIGLSVSILSICWAISSWVFSSVSDLLNSKKWLLIAFILLFSFASFSTGLATGLLVLLLARGLMGVAEGPVVTLVQATVIAESTPKRRGFNMGTVLSATSLLGMVLAPLLVVSIAEHSNWHNAFYLLAVPGVVVALILIKWMKEPVMSSGASKSASKPRLADYKEALKNRNVWLCTLISIGFMTWLFAFTTFAPGFFIEVDKVTPAQVSLIMSILGLGGFVWGIVAPMLSDRFGRKPIMLIFAFLGLLSPIFLATVPMQASHLMMIAFLLSFSLGYSPIFLTIIPSESTPKAFIATAMSIIVLVGEIFGGTIVPTVAGNLADKFGMTAPLWMASGGSLLVLIVSAFLKETAPVVVNQPSLAPNLKELETSAL